MYNVILLSHWQPQPHRMVRAVQTEAQLADALTGVYGDRLRRHVPLRPHAHGLGGDGRLAYGLWRRWPLRDAQEAVVHSTYVGALHRSTHVLTVHDTFWTDPAEHPGAARQRRARVAAVRSLPWVVTPSEHVRQQLVALGVEAGNVRVVPWGVAHEAFGPGPAVQPHGVPHVLTVGTVLARKRLEFVARALTEQPELAQVPWVHAGPRPTDRAGLALMQRLHQTMGSRFRFESYPDLPHLAGLYRGAMCVAHPSRDDGFPLPPLEAAACGVPSVVPDAPVHREVLGERAVRFDGTPEDFAQALVSLVVDGQAPVPSAQLMAHSRTFTWARCARQHAELYDEVNESLPTRKLEVPVAPVAAN